jgi:hypothetical protein
VALVYDSYGIDAGGVYRLGGHPYASVAAHPKSARPFSVVIYAYPHSQNIPRDVLFDTAPECHDYVLNHYAMRRLRGQNT